MSQGRFERRPAKPTLNPKRVVGGVKLSTRSGIAAAAGRAGAGPPAWVAQRWMRLVEINAAGPELAEGLEYARLGQTRSLDLKPGLISARVQGRMPRAYSVGVRLPTFTPEQWGPVIDAMVAQARYAAGLLAGELPPNVEDAFAPVGLRLFPTEASDLAVSCDCESPANGAGHAPAKAAAPWCKHACCVMALVAERLTTDPFLIFTLRGMLGEDLIERLRQRRAAAGAGRGRGAPAAPVYVPRLPGIADGTAPVRPLEQCTESFWCAGPGLEELDLPTGGPEVSHPLLRRLGSSPFVGAKFPLVGLLATCYDLIGAASVREEIGGDPAYAGSPLADGTASRSGPADS